MPPTPFPPFPFPLLRSLLTLFLKENCLCTRDEGVKIFVATGALQPRVSPFLLSRPSHLYPHRHEGVIAVCGASWQMRLHARGHLSCCRSPPTRRHWRVYYHANYGGSWSSKFMVASLAILSFTRNLFHPNERDRRGGTYPRSYTTDETERVAGHKIVGRRGPLARPWCRR